MSACWHADHIVLGFRALVSTWLAFMNGIIHDFIFTHIAASTNHGSIPLRFATGQAPGMCTCMHA